MRQDLFSGADVAMILDALWEMTNLYGKGEVYGCLVRVEVRRWLGRSEKLLTTLVMLAARLKK